MRFAVLLSLAALLGAGCALLLACGSSDDDLVPERDAAALKRYADRVSEASADGDCERVRADVERARERVNELPSKVDNDLQANIEAGFDNLAKQAERECQGNTETMPTETMPTETEPPVETTPPETTPPETEPPVETTPPETTPPETTPPEENGNGGTPAPGEEGRSTGGEKAKAKGPKKVKGQ